MAQGSSRALVAGAFVAAALAGCGGSDKPSYCQDRADLEQSVKGIGDVQVLESGGLQDLKTKLQKVETDANALVSSAKSDFASESNAIASSVSQLKTAVGALPSSPSPQQLATVAADVKAVASSVQAFDKATDSKCS